MKRKNKDKISFTIKDGVKTEKLTTVQNNMERLWNIDDKNNKEIGSNYSVIIDFTYYTEELFKVKKRFEKELKELCGKYRNYKCDDKGYGLKTTHLHHPLTQWNNRYNKVLHLSREMMNDNLTELDTEGFLNPSEWFLSNEKPFESPLNETDDFNNRLNN